MLWLRLLLLPFTHFVVKSGESQALLLKERLSKFWGTSPGIQVTFDEAESVITYHPPPSRPP